MLLSSSLSIYYNYVAGSVTERKGKTKQDDLGEFYFVYVLSE